MSGKGGFKSSGKKFANKTRNPKAQAGDMSSPKPTALPKSIGDALVDVYRGKRAEMESGLPSMSQGEIIQKAVRETRSENPKAIKKIREMAAKMKDGGGVCRGAGNVDGGNRGATFRGVR